MGFMISQRHWINIVLNDCLFLRFDSESYCYQIFLFLNTMAFLGDLCRTTRFAAMGAVLIQ